MLLPSVNRIPHDFKCLFIVWKCKCFVPKSALLSCPPTRICNHSVGVAIFPTCHQDESMRGNRTAMELQKKVPPRVARTAKKNGTRCALNCKNNWSSTRLWDRENTAGRTPDVSTKNALQANDQRHVSGIKRKRGGRTYAGRQQHDQPAKSPKDDKRS